ncbi:porin [Noviherbaspirillum saxi]|uniref:Porin n=1 Tax=Noviherbaspirillum saxi TaxID=2320863 RepID=A0A3A3FKL2_9BURK|nr:porin [Noviherbaspirillum saxi]RJF91875.1 porin [Noviherbaspirillum saxi]
MKESISVVAILGTFTGAACAQTTISVYGSVDLAVRHQTNVVAPPDLGTPVGSATAMVTGYDYINRLGFRGVEDLGGGLNARFNLEAGFVPDTGSLDNAAGRLFNRSATVGFGGPWGTVDIGHQYSAGYKTMAPYDALSARLPAVNPTVFLAPGGTTPGCRPITAGACARFDNDIQYTGVFGGLTLRAEYAFGEAPGSEKTGSAAGIGVNYAQSPFLIGATYTKQKAGNAIPPNLPAFPNYPGIALDADKIDYSFGGAYNRGPWRLAVGYAEHKADTIGGDTTIKGGWAGVTYHFSPAFSLTGAYYRVKLSTVALPVFRPDGKEKVDVGVLVARYALSKRTSLYAELDRSDWSNGANFARKTNAAEGLGVTQGAVAIGITHLF